MSYDRLRHRTPVALVGIVPCVVVVASTTPVRTPEELIAYARANRGKLSFSSSGVGNPQHVAGELMNSMAGTHRLHLPHPRAPPAGTHLAAGAPPPSLPPPPPPPPPSPHPPPPPPPPPP